MTAQNKQFLGWGLLGTPKGRQQTSDGIDKQVKFASSFDLDQEYGGCLPDPRQKDFTPLYCLKYHQTGNNHILGLAEYRPIFEQGQTRAGTYFGSFIECVNTCFGKNNLEEILFALFNLSDYQTKNFIDEATISYKESIMGKSFPAPDQQLNTIAENLISLPKKYFSQIEQQGDLYITCSEEQVVETLKQLLKLGLFYRFKQIFFSASPLISRQMQAKKLVSINFAELKAGDFFTQNWQDEVNYLHKYITQLHANEKATNEKYQQLERNFGNAVKQEAASYIQRAESAESELTYLRNNADILTNLGKTVLDTVATNAHSLNQEALAQFAPLSAKDDVSGQLNALQNQIAKLNMIISNSSNQEPQVIVETKATPLTWVFAGLSLFFVLCLAAYVLLFSGVSEESYKKLKKDFQEQTRQLNSIEKEKKELSEQQKNTEAINKDLQGKLNKTKEVCKQFAKKDKDQCEN